MPDISDLDPTEVEKTSSTLNVADLRRQASAALDKGRKESTVAKLKGFEEKRREARRSAAAVIAKIDKEEEEFLRDIELGLV